MATTWRSGGHVPRASVEKSEREHQRGGDHPSGREPAPSVRRRRRRADHHRLCAFRRRAQRTRVRRAPRPPTAAGPPARFSSSRMITSPSPPARLAAPLLEGLRRLGRVRRDHLLRRSAVKAAVGRPASRSRARRAHRGRRDGRWSGRPPPARAPCTPACRSESRPGERRALACASRRRERLRDAEVRATWAAPPESSMLSGLMSRWTMPSPMRVRERPRHVAQDVHGRRHRQLGPRATGAARSDSPSTNGIV